MKCLFTLERKRDMIRTCRLITTLEQTSTEMHQNSYVGLVLKTSEKCYPYISNKWEFLFKYEEALNLL